MAKKAETRNGSMLLRLFGLIVAIVLFSLLISGVFLLVLSSIYWKEQLLNDLTGEAGILSSSISYCMDVYEEDDILTVDEVSLPVLHSIRSVAATSQCRILLVDPRGEVVMCSDEEDGEGKTTVCGEHSGKTYDLALFRKIEKGNGDLWEYDGMIPGDGKEDYIAAAGAVRTKGIVRYYVVLLKTEKLAFRALSAKYSGMVIFSSSVAILLSFVAAYLVSYRVVMPLRRIGEATGQYAKGDFSVRIDASDTYREVRDLADSVNRMAEELSVMDESRSRFVANVSHELKTPMTIISGFIDGILDGTIDPQEREKYLTVVSDETKRLSRLVVDMLNMSKIEAGKLTLNLSPVELSTMILRNMLLFESKLTQNGIRVEGMDKMPRVTIMADEALLNQVFFNLIDNAVKFTPEKGVISVSLLPAKKSVTVVIRNTGKGIPEEERGRIFERFYKVDQSRGLDSASFGIGLPISKSIVELHNGTIRINSEENAYTEFVVTLPTDAAKE